MSDFQHIAISPLAGAIGAVVGVVDVSAALEDSVVAEIRRASLEHQVIFFRSQSLSVEQHKALTRHFGAVFVHPNFDVGGDNDPEIVRPDEACRPTENVHPVVRQPPETGRRCLFVNPIYTRRFEGMGEAESLPLLEFLWAHARRPEFTCRFARKPGSVAFGDNRCTRRYAIPTIGRTPAATCGQPRPPAE